MNKWFLIMAVLFCGCCEETEIRKIESNTVKQKRGSIESGRANQDADRRHNEERENPTNQKVFEVVNYLDSTTYYWSVMKVEVYFDEYFFPEGWHYCDHGLAVCSGEKTGLYHCEEDSLLSEKANRAAMRRRDVRLDRIRDTNRIVENPPLLHGKFKHIGVWTAKCALFDEDFGQRKLNNVTEGTFCDTWEHYGIKSENVTFISPFEMKEILYNRYLDGPKTK